MNNKIQCVCGSVYDEHTIKSLIFLGSADLEEDADVRLDLRRCLCGNYLCVDNLMYPLMRMRTEVFYTALGTKMYEGNILKLLQDFNLFQVRQLLRYALDTMLDADIFLMHTMCTMSKEDILKIESKNTLIKLVFRFTTHLRGVINNAAIKKV